MSNRRLAAAFALAASLALPGKAQAFCGFYVSGATAELYNNATVVVLMREGTRTVLSMANNYQGPPENFALVVPVPVVLQKDNVKTLPREIFTHVDQLAAPRLVEYWEQDPCGQQYDRSMAKGAGAPLPAPASRAAAAELGVTVEAQFTVGEYEVVILSAKDSTGLDTWLRQEKYNIPAGAEPILKPYVQGGMKFFVAKVDISKVQKQGDKTMLSPLRFHYDTDKFELPVRLGLLNSSGKQDLLVHILARGKRYELANYPNVTIPTNLDVGEITKEQFGPFYAALFDRTLETNPKAVVTEYAWDAGSCDPCPTPALRFDEVASLGADVTPPPDGAAPPPAPVAPLPKGNPRPANPGPGAGSPAMPGRSSFRPRTFFGGWTLTRLHARYGKETLGEDLVFREAPAITGGREVRNPDGKLEEGSQPTTYSNNFQARYAIRHPWKGPIECKEPRRGLWGGPPGQPWFGGSGGGQAKPATDLAFQPRGQTNLPAFLRTDVPGLNIKAAAAEPSPVPVPSGTAANGNRRPDLPSPASGGSSGAAPSGGEPARKGCGGCASPGQASAGAPWLLFAAALGLRLARRGRR